MRRGRPPTYWNLFPEWEEREFFTDEELIEMVNNGYDDLVGACTHDHHESRHTAYITYTAPKLPVKPAPPKRPPLDLRVKEQPQYRLTRYVHQVHSEMAVAQIAHRVKKRGGYIDRVIPNQEGYNIVFYVREYIEDHL